METVNDLPILVCGFLGAGKSTMSARLRELGHEAEEVDGLLAPSVMASDQHRRVITVVDCANAKQHLEDPELGSLLRRQIEAAGLIALSRGDLSDPAPVHAMVEAIADCPVIDAPHGALSASDLDGLAASELNALSPADDLTAKFGTLEYRGGAIFRVEQAERLIANRPNGIERMTGILRTESGGMEVQLAGRMRQTQDVTLPAQTELVVRWRRAETAQAQIDLWFAEAVADSGHRRGLFGYR
ncbi:MAG: hypothetical protein AAGH68_08645 [Pseudomonadota bacterium]